MGANEADSLERIVHFVCLWIISIAAQTAAQDDRVDAVVIEEGNEIGSLAADIQRSMAAAAEEFLKLDEGEGEPV